MGTDSAPSLANKFLFYYEYNFMTGLIKTNINLAKRFNTSLFKEEIYPPELILKRTTECSTGLSNLDLCIQIINGKYCTKVYILK